MPAAIGMIVLAKPVYTLYSVLEMIQRWGESFYSIMLLLAYYFLFYSNGCYATRNQSTAEDGARTSDWNYCENSFKYCIASVFRLCKFYYFNIRGLYDFSWV